jgi:pre-mRNA-splicing factor 38A
LPKRSILEDQDELEPRVSVLGDIEDLLESDVEEVKGDGSGSERKRSPGSEFGEEFDGDRDRDVEVQDKANGMDTS